MYRVLQDVHLLDGGGERVLRALNENEELSITVGLGDPIGCARDLGGDPQVLIRGDRYGADALTLLSAPGVLESAQARVPKVLDLVLHHHLGLSLAGGSDISRAYIHSPTRMLFEPTRVPWEVAAIGEKMRDWMLGEELRALQATSIVYTNSRATRDRIQRYYGVDSRVAYPPLSAPVLSSSQYSVPESVPLPLKYVLTVGRLAPSKELMETLAVAEKLPFPWVVAGSGRLASILSASPPANVLFVGAISETEKVALIDRATACIATTMDDFGIFAAEALARNRPVAARTGTGALELASQSVAADYDAPDLDSGLSLVAAIELLSEAVGDEKNAASVRHELSPQRFSRTLFP